MPTQFDIETTSFVISHANAHAHPRRATVRTKSAPSPTPGDGCSVLLGIVQLSSPVTKLTFGATKVTCSTIESCSLGHAARFFKCRLPVTRRKNVRPAIIKTFWPRIRLECIPATLYLHH